MRAIRYLLILMGLWVFLVDDVGQALGVASLSPYAYMIMIACAILPILYPTKGISSLAVLSTSVVLLIGLKVWNGGTIDAESLPRMAVETGAIGLTIILANLLGTQVNAIQQIFEDAGLSKLQKNVDSFDAGQTSIYREIRWSRRYHRSATLLAVSIDGDSLEKLLEQSRKRDLTHRLMNVMQREVWRTYALSQLAKLLVDELGDSAIITQRKEHFVILLAEVDREQSHDIVARLKTKAEEKLGVRLNIGAALFPDEEVTFEMLLVRAEAAMLAPTDESSPSMVFAPAVVQAEPVAANLSEVRANDEAMSPA